MFLADVGRGLLTVSLGPMACELGLSKLRAGDDSNRLQFGPLEPLVGVMQDTPAEQLLPALIAKMNGGVELKTLVAAGALANARTFGGQDYDGYHALMALAPAYQMAGELPAERRPLPVLKVLHRNTRRMQAFGGKAKEVLKPLPLTKAKPADGATLRDNCRRADVEAAERTLATMTGPVGEAYNHLQFAVQDEIDVHRVVLAWRAWVLLDFTGTEQAQTLLRQSVRFCVNSEQERLKRGNKEPAIRALLPKLLDEHKLLRKSLGNRKADDAWVQQLAQTVFAESRERAAEAVAAALAEGFSPEDIGEALTLAASRLTLHDPGRDHGDAEKPKGSVHGASVGVHATDAANAWRNIARVSNPRNTVASLIVGAYHTAGQSGRLNPSSYPTVDALSAVKSSDPAGLLGALEEAIKVGDQVRACAVMQRYNELGHAPRGAFDVLLKYAVSEDGALHAEKYYRTITEEFASSRPAFRGQHLVALARVTASEHGHPAPGYSQACQLLKL